MWATCLLLVDKPILGQRLAGNEPQLLTRLATDGDFRKPAQVLTHVEHKDGILADGVPYAEALHNLHRFSYLFAQCATRSLLNDHRVPFFFPFQPRVVVLAAIDAVERNGRQCPLPRMIADHIVGRAVVIGYVQAEQQCGRAEGYLHLRIALALLVVESVAQQDTNLEQGGGRREESSDIVGVVEHRFVVVAPQRGKLAITDFLSVQCQLIEAETTDVDSSPLDTFTERHVTPDADAPVRQWVNSSPGGLDSRFLQFGTSEVSSLGQLRFLLSHSSYPSG